MRLRIKLSIILTCIFLATVNLDAGEIIGEWTFDNEQNPGKATIGLDAKVYGKPTIVKGVFGKALQLHGAFINDKQDHNYLKVANNPNLEVGDKSFSVECWVKANDIGYYQFIGKRLTARPSYQQKGWCLGMENGGALCFTVDDGKTKRNTAKIHFLSCDWDIDDWNYLVGVRDCEKKELRLYVNGKLAAKVADKAGNIANNLGIRIGYDETCGVFMDGKLDDLRITRGVLTDKQIEANFSYRLELLPQPQKIIYSKEVVPIVSPVKILMPSNPTPVEKTALELLQKDLKHWFNFDLETTKQANLNKGTLIELGRATPELHAEGYRLEKKADENIVRILSNDNGIIYGALTLIQIMKKTAQFNNDLPAFPNAISINDYPLIANRIVVSGVHSEFNKLEKARNAFDIRMRNRLNGIILGQWRVKKETPEAFKNLVNEATKRGITTWATFSYYRARNKGEGLVPSNAADRRKVADFFAKAGAAGCRAFAFYFDDISKHSLVLRDAKFDKKIGLFQQEFIKIMVEEGNKFNITNYVVCPTPYMRNWQRSANIWWGRNGIEYDQYFKELTDAPGLENVSLLHCDFYPEKLKELRAKGLRKYAYWVNGLWTTQRWFSWNVGPRRLAWTWYGFSIDGEKGPQPIAESQEHWRNIANETDIVMLGTSGGYTIAGIWLWNPPVFNDNEVAKAACSQVFGSGSYNLLVKYSNGMAPLVSLFKTYKTTAVSECHPPVIKLKTPLTAEQLQNYWAGLKKAKDALAKLKELPEKQKSIFERGTDPSYYLKHMDMAIEKATKKLKSKLERNGVATE